MLENVIGQKRIKSFIERSVESGKINQSYIIEGEKGMGRKTVGYSFACALVCENKNGCGVCKSCVLAKAGTHPDIITIKPAEDKKTIGVDEAREASVAAYIKPYSADKKIVVLVGDITEAGQNALLKIIEEPPSYMVFMFITSPGSTIIETVRSRSCILRLMPYTKDQIDEIASQKGIGGFEEYVYAYSQGNVGKALEIAEDSEFKKMRLDAIDAILSLRGEGQVATFGFESYFEACKDSAEAVLDIMHSIMRDIIIIKLGEKKLVLNVDVLPRLELSAHNITTKAAINAAETILKYKRMLKSNVNFAILSASLSIELWEVLCK